MLSLAHGLTGAYLGSLFPEAPYIYIPAALALHFVEDAVPHWDFGTGMHSGHRKKLTAALFEIVELVALAVIIFFVWRIPHSPAQLSVSVYLGALAGISIDLLEAPKTFFNLHLPFLRPMSVLHQKVHSSTPNLIWGLAPQLLICAAIIFLAR